MSNTRSGFGYISGRKYDGMMGRCYRTSDGSYPNYGGRGIRICSAWIKDIESFRNWIRSELYKMNVTEDEFSQSPRTYSLDRINVNGHYTPDNCRLSSTQVQGRNRRRSKLTVISAEGEEICA